MKTHADVSHNDPKEQMTLYTFIPQSGYHIKNYLQIVVIIIIHYLYNCPKMTSQNDPSRSMAAIAPYSEDPVSV